MDHKLIISRLQAALEAVSGAIQTDEIQLALILHAPEKAHPSIGLLLEALRSQAPLSIFDGMMQVLVNQATRMDISNLAAWLLRRGISAGPEQAVLDLQQYLDAKEIPFRLTLALTGLKVDHQCNFGGGISLIPWEKLPNSPHKNAIHSKFMSSLGFKWPSAVIVQDRLLPKIHTSDKDDIKLSSLDETDIHDALLCMGVIGPFAPETLASWLDPPAWAPMMGIGYSLPHSEGRPRHDTWTNGHCDAAIGLFKQFHSMPPERKDSLRLPLQRLNMAMRRLSNVDSVIDLGIALEALFLNDQAEDRGELTFRLRLRTARYLETNSEPRQALFRVVGDLYRLRSIAVHTGRIPNDIRGRPISELLNDGYRLTAMAIRRFVVEGTPNWHTVQLS